MKLRIDTIMLDELSKMLFLFGHGRESKLYVNYWSLSDSFCGTLYIFDETNTQSINLKSYTIFYTFRSRCELIMHNFFQNVCVQRMYRNTITQS